MQSIPVRALIAALLLLVSSQADAESLAERRPWHATVAAPRPGLPDVTIDFGYPGPYVPMLSSPITIRATAAGIPFDGYIGYHFAVGERHTLDTPVVARARIRPRESWTFTTTAAVRKCCIQNLTVPREIAIEWRNSSMKLIASQTAGAPPWTSFGQTLRPLRVIAPSEAITTAQALGGEAYVERASALADRAQWYAGFSAVVIPLNTWIDLPKKPREAIFGSGVSIVFFGLPRPNQQLDTLDRTLLPVAFSATPGSWVAPWPYRSSQSTAFSWKAKAGADKIGSDQNPYIARTGAASWAADEMAVGRPLPAMTRFAARPAGFLSFDELNLQSWWTDRSSQGFARRIANRHFLSGYSGMITAIIAGVLVIASWLLLRKTPRAFAAVAVVLIATVLFAQRSRIRPQAAVLNYDIRSPVAPGVVDHRHFWRAYGPAPLAPVVLDPGEAQTSITGDYGNWESAEVRTSNTPASMGLLVQGHEYDAATRWSFRRELDNSSTSDSTRTRGVRVQYDFHTPIVLWMSEMHTGDSGSYRIEGRLRTQPDGSGNAAFALPTDGQRAYTTLISGPSVYTGRDLEIVWQTGRLKLTLSKGKDIYTAPTAEIPRDVCRDIAAHGGIVEVTMKGPIEYDLIWIEVREHKS